MPFLCKWPHELPHHGVGDEPCAVCLLWAQHFWSLPSLRASFIGVVAVASESCWLLVGLSALLVFLYQGKTSENPLYTPQWARLAPEQVPSVTG